MLPFLLSFLCNIPLYNCLFDYLASSTHSFRVKVYEPKAEFHTFADNDNQTPTLKTLEDKKALLETILLAGADGNSARSMAEREELRVEESDDGFFGQLFASHFIQGKLVINQQAKMTFTSTEDGVKPVSWSSNFKLGARQHIDKCIQEHKQYDCINQAAQFIKGSLNRDFGVFDVFVATTPDGDFSQAYHFQLDNSNGEPQFEVAVDKCSLALVRYVNYQSDSSLLH